MKKYIIYTFLIFLTSIITGQENSGLPNYEYTIQNLEINSKYQDYGVTIVGDSLVYFASSRKVNSIRNKNWQGNNQPFLQLYKGNLTSANEIENIELVSKRINSKYHDANLTFTKDLSTVYFTRNNYLNKKFKKDTLGRNLNQLYKATIDKKGKWTVYQMPFNNDNYQTGHPALSPNEDKLYFISDMPGGYGATDIYVVDILENGSYSSPKNLGPSINTEGKEMFPHIRENNLIYFASDGFADGIGGLDMYVSEITNESNNSNPVNLGKPLNTKLDDFGYVIKPNSNIGFFSSNRAGGKGDDDIYAFIETEVIKPECTQLITGTVIDKSSNSVIRNTLVELMDISGNLIESVQSNSKGEFNFKVKCDTEYLITATKTGYSINQLPFKSTEEFDFKHTINIALEPSDFTRKNGYVFINISPIFFELDKWNIRPDAAEILENVFRILKKFPDVNVNLESHTDSRANDNYNSVLSKKRAKSSLEWLLRKGINPERITAKGYGETRLVNKCSNNVKCTEAEHQLNRRTEFIITNPEVLKGKVKIE